MAESLRVAVVAPRSVPNIAGGAERHWSSLVEGLRTAGHRAELVAIDTRETTFAEVLGSYRTFVRLDLADFDVVISGKYPSWMVQHPRHIRHLNHPLRGLYERYPATLPQPEPGLVATVQTQLLEHGPEGLIEWALGQPDQRFPGPVARATVVALDRFAADNITAHAAVSNHVARRPGYLPEGVAAAIIPPLTDLEQTTSSEAGNHFLAFGRLTPIKRLDLTIKAFARASMKGAELKIAGTGPEQQRLAQLAGETAGVTLLGHVADDELAELLATARAVVALPEDEDFGLIAAEAMAAGRPVITTTDSGGVAEQVEDGVNGLVVPPLAPLVGRAMKRLTDEPQLADRLGRAGRDLLASRSWAPMVRMVERVAAPSPKPTVLLLSTFPAEPVRGGGARRLRGIAATLQTTSDVTVLSLTNTVGPGRVERRVLADGVLHVSVGRSRAHLKADSQMAALVGTPVDDIGCSVLHPSTQAWRETLESELASADTVILAHPYLAPSLATVLDNNARGSVVYDGHNVEVDLKTALLKEKPGRDRLLQWVEAAEQQAMDCADVVTATSSGDAVRFGELYDTSDVLVVPNGVEPSLLAETQPQDRVAARRDLLADLGLDPADDRPIALFVASDHPPNHAAADELATMATAHPELIVVLAGAHSERPRAGVHNYGRFADASHRRLLLGADVALNTVADGSGTNLKLIEALAVGTPVIATKVGARGLVTPEKFVTIVGENDPLASCISVVVSGPSTKAKVAAGRGLAASHTWASAVGPLEAAIRNR